MSDPIVSRLWIAAADRVIDRAEALLPDEAVTAVRMRLRAAAVEVEELISTVADGGRVERSHAVAILVRRFGTEAVDVDRIAAMAIAEAVAATPATVGLEGSVARRLAEACSDAVLDAAGSLEALLPTDGARRVRSRSPPRSRRP